MAKQILTAFLSGIFVLTFSCSDKPDPTKSTTEANTLQMPVTVDTLRKILEAFNRHDLDAIMEHFTEDCTMDFPKGPEYFGQRLVGKKQVREAISSRLTNIPDVHYGDDRHWVSADQSRGASEWTLTGTTTAGVKLKVRGCDLWEFKNGKVSRKDSYWKIVEQTATKTN